MRAFTAGCMLLLFSSSHSMKESFDPVQSATHVRLYARDADYAYNNPDELENLIDQRKSSRTYGWISDYLDHLKGPQVAELAKKAMTIFEELASTNPEVHSAIKCSIGWTVDIAELLLLSDADRTTEQYTDASDGLCGMLFFLGYVPKIHPQGPVATPTLGSYPRAPDDTQAPADTSTPGSFPQAPDDTQAPAATPTPGSFPQAPDDTQAPAATPTPGDQHPAGWYPKAPD